MIVKTMAAALVCAAMAGCSPTVTGADFAAWEQGLVAQGRLRTDRDPSDARYTNATLAKNFELIAFNLEASVNRGRPLKVGLARWAEPIRWYVAAPPSEALAVKAEVQDFMTRVAGVTGLDIAEADEEQLNLLVLQMGPGNYETVKRAFDGPDTAHVAADVEDFRTNDSLVCAGVVYRRPEAEGALTRNTIRFAMVFLRAGYSKAMRRSCIEEEIAQSLGLQNDHPSVRPSIFNDDEEFALLTSHDELLLRILYDQRLKSGMRPKEAMPLVAAIIEDLRPQGQVN